MQAYAICYRAYPDARPPNGDFLLATKLAKGYFFWSWNYDKRAYEGTIVKRGQDLNAGGFPAFPGGKVNPSESPVEATRREWWEETVTTLSDPAIKPIKSVNFGKFAAVYYPIEKLGDLMTAVNERLQIGIGVQHEIIYSANPQYDALVTANPRCPRDNELATIAMWNVFYDWNAIQHWQGNDVIGWYYDILVKFRDLLDGRELT